MTQMPQQAQPQPQQKSLEAMVKGIAMLVAWLAFVALLVQTAVNALAAWLGFAYVDYMTALYVMLALAGVRITWGMLANLGKPQQAPNDLQAIFGQAFAQGFVMHKMLQEMPSAVLKDAGIRPS